MRKYLNHRIRSILAMLSTRVLLLVALLLFAPAGAFAQLVIEGQILEDYPGIRYDAAFTYFDSNLGKTLTRQVVIVLPTKMPPGKRPGPLLVMCHGTGGTAVDFSDERAEFVQHTNAAGWILLFPEATFAPDGSGTRWNSDLDPLGPNDEQFIVDLINAASGLYRIDSRRTRIAGFSGGAVMAAVMAAKNPNLFAAGAFVAGSLGVSSAGGGLVLQPTPEGAVPALIVNGTFDPLRPYIGGINANGSEVTPARQQVVHWINGNGVTNPGSVEILQGIIVNGADSQVVIETYQRPDPPATDFADVVFVTIEQGEHVWPSSAKNMGFDGDKYIFDFLNSYTN